MGKIVIHCGVDVSSKKLDICMEAGATRSAGTFENTPAGHAKLVRHLNHKGRTARVVVEATGVYSFELCLALHRAPRVELMVVNPKAASDFGSVLMKRSKTDTTDAESLLEYVKRMDFVAWVPPRKEVVDIQRISRRRLALGEARTQELNRLAAMRRLEGTEAICAEIESHIEYIDASRQRLLDQGLEIVAAVPELDEMFRHLSSIKGIAEGSGLALTAELAALPSDMTARQWVAHCGLDPRHHESGTSVHRKTRISKAGNVYLRAALYMPAMVASRCEPSVRSFYLKLIGRGKLKMVALVAVMRKLLHALHGMVRTKTDFDGTKFHAVSA